MSIGWANANIHPRARQARIQNRASNEGLLPSPPHNEARRTRMCPHPGLGEGTQEADPSLGVRIHGGVGKPLLDEVLSGDMSPSAPPAIRRAARASPGRPRSSPSATRPRARVFAARHPPCRSQRETPSDARHRPIRPRPPSTKDDHCASYRPPARTRPAAITSRTIRANDILLATLFQ